MYYSKPGGTTYKIYGDLLESPHLLIGGTTGSGKSVCIRNLLNRILYESPEDKKLILLDPKRVDFNEFNEKGLPHIIKYANKPETMIIALENAIDIMEKRYDYMLEHNMKMWNGSDVYVVIDEYADLKDVGGKDVESKVIRLCQLARAARVHIILATQRTIACVTPRIRTNLDTKLALHTSSRKESINLIELGGAEKLPLYGYGILSGSDGYRTVELPYTTEQETIRLINFWMTR